MTKINKRKLVIVVGAVGILFGTVIGSIYYIKTQTLDSQLASYSSKAIASYTGETRNGVPHGDGIMKYKDGSTYTGQFVDGKPHGLGTLVAANGEIYIGTFDRGKFGAGKDGRLEFPDHSFYDGVFVDGKLNGKGLKSLSSGETRYGTFKDNKLVGYGEIDWDAGQSFAGTFKDGKYDGPGVLIELGESLEEIRSEGEFHNNLLNGEGRKEHSGQYVYVGSFKDGKFDGQGRLELASGIIQEGQFKNGLPHGELTVTLPDEWTFHGTFENGLASGAGTVTIYRKDRTITTSGFLKNSRLFFPKTAEGTITWKTGQKFTGKLRDGYKPLDGTLEYANGLRYTGRFIDGKPSDGEFSFSNGTIYSGPVTNGQPSGFGELRFKDGRKYIGSVILGDPAGDGTLTLPDGTTVSGNFTKTGASPATVTLSDGTKIVADRADLDGLASGNVLVVFPNKDFYFGEYAAGKPSGAGFMQQTDGDRIFRGFTEDGEPSGAGRYFSVSSADFIEGTFKDGKLTDTVTWTYLGTTADGENYGTVFEPESKEDPIQVHRLIRPSAASPVAQYQAEMLAVYVADCDAKTLRLMMTKMRSESAWTKKALSPIQYDSGAPPALKKLGELACFRK